MNMQTIAEPTSKQKNNKHTTVVLFEMVFSISLCKVVILSQLRIGFLGLKCLFHTSVSAKGIFQTPKINFLSYKASVEGSKPLDGEQQQYYSLTHSCR
jgi:hypothetical protein